MTTTTAEQQEIRVLEWPNIYVPAAKLWVGTFIDRLGEDAYRLTSLVSGKTPGDRTVTRTMLQANTLDGAHAEAVGRRYLMLAFHHDPLGFCSLPPLPDHAVVKFWSFNYQKGFTWAEMMALATQPTARGVIYSNHQEYYCGTVTVNNGAITVTHPEGEERTITEDTEKCVLVVAG